MSRIMSRILINSTSLTSLFPSFPIPGMTVLNRGSPGLMVEFVTGLVTRPVSAARFGAGTSLLTSRPDFRFVVFCVFRVRVRILVFVFYEPRLALLLNVRALSVTVCSRTVIAEHLREKRKPLSTDERIIVVCHY